jgi:hypothetical protein
MEVLPSEENNTYIKAKKRVKKLKDFYSHTIAYIFFTPLWIYINYISYWEFKWFWFPVIGMGISVVIHAFIVFGYNSDWEERKLKEFMEKDNF